MSLQKVQDAQERASKLIVKAEELMSNRANKGRRDDDVQQKVYDLRAAIAVRETLRGELEQHKARRGRLTELHNELNVAEEQLATIKLDINEHQMMLVETEQKMNDVEGHMNILFTDLAALKDQLPRLVEIEYYHQAKIDELALKKEEAEALVAKKRQIVKETEEQLHHIMNIGMSSQMWQADEASGDYQRTGSPTRRTMSRKWSTVGKVQGEEIIYHEELTPRTAAWAEKHRSSKTKYYWQCVYNAVKLGYLTRKIPFPPEAFSRMMAYIHGNDDAATIRKLTEQLKSASSLVEIQADSIRKLEFQLKQRSEKGKDAERKLAVLQEKYERTRVESSAMKSVLASLNDKSVIQLQRENELYEAERQVLYAKIHGKLKDAAIAGSTGSMRRGTSFANASPEPFIVPPITESKLALKASDASPPASPQRKHTLKDSLEETKSAVLEKVKSFNAAPTGIGFLQSRLDEHIVEQQMFRKQLQTVRTKNGSMRLKLELTESIALHSFDSYARGRQTAEEELEKFMVESQRRLKEVVAKHTEEKVRLEAQVLQLTQSLTSTQRELTLAQDRTMNLEVKVDELTSANESLDEQLKETATQLSAATELVDPGTYTPLSHLCDRLQSFQPQSLVDYDMAIGRILPMKSQRAFTQLVLGLLQATKNGFSFVAVLMQKLLQESVRKSAHTVEAAATLGSKMSESFDKLTELCSTIGRAGLNAIELWEEHRREFYKSVETDVEGLPQPVVVIEKQVPVNAAPACDVVETAVQAGEACQTVAAQTNTILSSDMQTETTVVLGKGGDDGHSGFVSTETLKKMEELLKAKIKEADHVQQVAEAMVKEAAGRVDDFKRLSVELSKRHMEAEDDLSKLRTLCEKQQRLLNTKKKHIGTSLRPGDIIWGIRDVQTQIYFPENNEARLALVASKSTQVATSKSLIELFDVHPTERSHAGTDTSDIPAPTPAPVVHSYVTHYKELRHTATSPIACPMNSVMCDTDELEEMFARQKSCSDASNAKETSSIETRAEDEAVTLSRFPIFDIPTSTSPTHEFASDSPTALAQVDALISTHALAEMEMSIERRLVEQFEEHKALLSQHVREKEESLERHSEEVDRAALKLRLKVSNMQQDYEAIAASVTRFKFMASQLRSVTAELGRERVAREDAERHLAELTEAKRSKTRSASSTSPTASSSKAVVGFDLGGTAVTRGVTTAAHSDTSMMLLKHSTSFRFAGPGDSAPATASQSAAAAVAADQASEHRAVRRERDQLAMQLECTKQRVEQLEEKLKSLTPSPIVKSSSTGHTASGDTNVSVLRASKRFASAMRLARNPTTPSAVSEHLYNNVSSTGGLDTKCAEPSLVQALTERVNELQMQALTSHKDLLELRSRYSTDTLALKQEIDRLGTERAEAELAQKRLSNDVKQLRHDLEKERKVHKEALLTAEDQRNEVERKLTNEVQKLNGRLEAEKRSFERSEQSLLQAKRKLEDTKRDLEGLQKSANLEADIFLSKSRACAQLVSQLHCALVEAAVHIKSELQLTGLQLADPMMGETAVQLMKALSSPLSETTASSPTAGSDAQNIVDIAKHLGDRDVDLLKRLSKAIKHASGNALDTSADVSRLPSAHQDLRAVAVAEVNEAARFSTQTTVALAHMDPPSPPVLTLPQVEWRSKSPTKAPRFDIKVAKRDTSFSLMPTVLSRSDAEHHQSVQGASTVAGNDRKFSSWAQRSRELPSGQPSSSTPPHTPPYGPQRSVSASAELLTDDFVVGKSQQTLPGVDRVVHGMLPTRAPPSRQGGGLRRAKVPLPF